MDITVTTRYSFAEIEIRTGDTTLTFPVMTRDFSSAAEAFRVAATDLDSNDPVARVEELEEAVKELESEIEELKAAQ